MNDFYGLPADSLTSDFLRVDYLTTAGPRLVRLFLAGSEENLLAELPEAGWETTYGHFYLRGGHRLWAAPEAPDRSDYPDNEGVTVTATAGSVQIAGPVEAATGLRKVLVVTLAPDAAALTLEHRLENHGLWPIETAPWAITQLPHGGEAYLPFPQEPVDAAGLLPNRSVALWSYVSWHDPRLQLDDDLLCVRGLAIPSIFKIGTLTRTGRIAYLRNGVLLLREFDPQPDAAHPDYNCNAEIYANEQFLELEALGPLRSLPPGRAAVHVERWQLLQGEFDRERIRGLLDPAFSP
ncbi:MAG: hypothetical protein GX579_04905 [Chloroflexi bacterium]|nr:hypothetical protein [Chloroflexota bacterium]